MNSRFLKLFDRQIRIDFDDRTVGRWISACYSAFAHDDRAAVPDLVLTVRRTTSKTGWTVDDGTAVTHCEDLADLVYFIEKGMTVALQRIRQDLYFVHAAAVAWDSTCTLLIGESGVGKSTLCWGLCHLGFTYMSDELAPLDPDRLLVEPYPHAFCLKSEAHVAPPLPDSVMRTEATLHVPVEALPAVRSSGAVPVRNLIFLTHGTAGSPWSVDQISSAEAAARLYANGLNQLAHEHDGLAAAARIASGSRAFHMTRTDPASMRRVASELIRGTGSGTPP